MTDYVMEAGSTSLCKLEHATEAAEGGCSAKEVEYVSKWSAKPSSEAASELARLQGVKKGGKKMKASQASWVGQRVAILKQMASDSAQQAEL